MDAISNIYCENAEWEEKTLPITVLGAVLQKLEYFRETGRPDEAADEGTLAVKQNVFSWTNLKTLCNLGVGNPENIYTNLLTCVNEARSAHKPKTSKR